jgi:5'-phosphate synthase pdxT subunit
MPVLIGVLALQGAFKEHQEVLERLGAASIQVRNVQDLEGIDGLIIPGGESTSMTLSAERLGLWSHVKELLDGGLPTWGTCAGAIMLCRTIDNQMHGGQGSLALLDVAIKRNAYGSQIASFCSPLSISDGSKFPGVFIRAPAIESFDPERYKVIAQLSEKYDLPIAGLKGEHIMITTFHPELTDDAYFHNLFLSMIKEQ